MGYQWNEEKGKELHVWLLEYQPYLERTQNGNKRNDTVVTIVVDIRMAFRSET